MRYVILRDDDTNALTPVEQLDRLYRPFLDRRLPVNLAVIPEVATDTRMAGGHLEGYLDQRNGEKRATIPIGTSAGLVRYLKENPGYHVVQHGYRHDLLEFDRLDRAEAARRLEQGTRALTEAGFAQPQTFVAPYDRLSRGALHEVARRFRVLSTGWYEWARLPRSWWPQYLLKKLRRAPHWRIGRTWLLSHPGCLLSCHRPLDSMIEKVLASLRSRRLTVLVTHGWEYFRNGQPNEAFIGVLHEIAGRLARDPEIQVISFAELAADDLALAAPGACGMPVQALQAR